VSKSRVIRSTQKTVIGGYDVDDIAGCVSPTAAWSASCMAVQPGLGLLSERWLGPGSRSFAGSAARWKIVKQIDAAVAYALWSK